MTETQFVITVVVFALSVQITRALPFIIFRDASHLPKIIEYLGKVLPASMMGLLVVYCFKDVNFTVVSEIVPALVAAVVVVTLHLWKRNTVLSISAGTILYMVLIRVM